MKIACIQMEMVMADPDRNYIHAVKEVREAAANGADVAVLPETWNVGFFPREDLADLADRDGCRTREVFGSLARELGINIVAGSVANLRSDGVYNTCLVFNRKGECVAEYDKTHLFSPMEEDLFFRKGDHVSTFMLDGLRCGVIICYDVRFPELTRTMTVGGLDVLFMVSQWPLVRVSHLEALTAARAIENQMFVACCNSAEKSAGTVYGGHSAVIDPWGVRLAQMDAEPGILYATIDPSILDGIRKSINVFADRRPELYKVN
ncbi:MAG: carbon-nitrogen family hydrolase [Spirochaetales bacterium]|nr:carbon-nitrogen family hydrolase [Spirochaetales bacterium]